MPVATKHPGRCVKCGLSWEARYARASLCRKCKVRLRQQRYRARRRNNL